MQNILKNMSGFFFQKVIISYLCGLLLYKLYKNIKNKVKNETPLASPLKIHIGGILEKMHNTPLIYLKSLSELTGCHIYGKCEYMLPYTSKDRMVKAILLDAMKKGLINHQSVIYEGSSGSTAYSVAAISRLLGLKCKIVVPDDVSQEKMQLLQTTDCEIIITKQCPFSNFNENFIRKAKKLAREDPNGFYVDQFYNELNYMSHYKETGPEIWQELNGSIDYFVASAGTGGTIGGISNYLKEQNNNIQVILADVNGSGLHSYIQNKVMFTKEETEAMRKKYRYYSIIEGIGINFVSYGMEKSLIDTSYRITDDEAIFMANYLYKNDGVFIGGSSAVNLCAVLKKAKSVKKGSVFVTMLYDSGLKYTSKLFNQEILKSINIKNIDEI
jgi:cysteine synthase A